ncbi:Uncharacterized protein QTN25_007813 [Entamoeba marina]
MSFDDPFLKNIAGIIITSTDENIDKLEETLLSNGYASSLVTDSINTYADNMNLTIEKVINQIMSKYLGKEDTRPIPEPMNVDPIIEEISNTLKASIRPIEPQQQSNTSVTHKINQLMLDDVKETRELFTKVEQALESIEPK